MASHHVHSPHDVAADASFLEAMPILELHRSNVLRLETEELLKTCRLDVLHTKWHTSSQQYLATVNQVLQDIETNVTISKEDSCPLPLQADKQLATPIVLEKPLQVHWNYNHTTMGLTTRAGNAKELPLLECSIALDIWGNKDYLHYRYFHKRNLIVWHILLHLQKHSKLVGKVQWRNVNGNPQLPCILLTPPPATATKKSIKKRKDTKTTTAKFQVEIRVGMHSIDWIPPTRLFPNRSNLRGEKLSVVYNHDLVKDQVVQQHEEQEFPLSLQDTLILLKVWCLQRGLVGGHDSFSIHDVAFLLQYLLRTKLVTPRMAPLQCMTVFFKFISETEWLMEDDDRPKKALVLPALGLTEAQTIQQCRQARLYAQYSKESPVNNENGGDPATLLDCFRECSKGPIFLNSEMTGNMWGRLSPSFVVQLQLACRKSLECLHSTTVTRPFQYLFLQEARFWNVMDAVMRIPLAGLQKQQQEEEDSSFANIATNVVRVLKRALGDRVHLIRVLTTGNGRISTTVNNPSQIPIHDMTKTVFVVDEERMSSPTGEHDLVLGFTLNPETCHRVVDRGPPVDNVEATRDFMELWGKDKAQLRRFKDGAIVHAVVWNTTSENETDSSSYIRMESDDKTQGGIVERIVRHILQLHFIEKKKTRQPLQFALCNMLSLVDGVVVATRTSAEDKLLVNSMAAFRNVMSAFESLSEFIRQNSSPTIPVPGSTDAKTSKLGVPLAIDGVEPISPSLRYSELFPPVPHPSLGGPRADKKVSGVAPTPILIQVRFGLSSKWPTDFKAMGAAKTAMLIQLANGIESMRSGGFEGPIQVTPSYMDIGYMGYSWRIVVRADPELHMLRKLQNPTPEATSLLRVLTKDHVVSVMHHSTIHAIHTLHPSSGSVVRLAKRWTACHLLSDLIPFEAIELLVAKVYTNRDVPLDPPATIVSGFLRFLHLLATHDWTRHPLVVDPHGHISEDDHSDIVTQFEHARGPDYKNGPPMYIVSPNDRRSGSHEEDEPKTGPKADKESSSSSSVTWAPTFTQQNPECVVLSRAAVLAKRSHDFLMEALSSNHAVDWSVVFHETPSSFMSYGALLRADSDFIVDKECSSTGSQIGVYASKDGVLESSFTRSMRQRSLGPKALRRKVYRNLSNSEEDVVLHGWRPVEELVQSLRKVFGSLALFFYNDLAPEVIGVLWRPTSFVPQPLSIAHSEYVRPVEAAKWQSDSLVVHNTNDILRGMSEYTDGIIANVKVLDDRSIKVRPTLKKRSAPDSSDGSSNDRE